MMGELTGEYLDDLLVRLRAKSDPDKPFFYLGGPMTSIPQFNFPAFHRAAEELRAAGYNIVSPAELDDPDVEKEAQESDDGFGVGNHSEFLQRDLIICALPNCVGGIFLDGWWNSRGARAETWILTFLGKQTMEFYVNEYEKPVLVAIERDRRLFETTGMEDECVTSMKAGERSHAVLV